MSKRFKKLKDLSSKIPQRTHRTVNEYVLANKTALSLEYVKCLKWDRVEDINKIC